jgi:hypothetical protein
LGGSVSKKNGNAGINAANGVIFGFFLKTNQD